MKKDYILVQHEKGNFYVNIESRKMIGRVVSVCQQEVKFMFLRYKTLASYYGILLDMLFEKQYPGEELNDIRLAEFAVECYLEQEYPTGKTITVEY